MCQSINKSIIGGITALVLTAGITYIIHDIKKGEHELAKVRQEIETIVVSNDDFWKAQTPDEATQIYYKRMATCAKKHYQYAFWMPKKLEDLENCIVWKLYISEATRAEFAKKDSLQRINLYDEFKAQGY